MGEHEIVLNAKEMNLIEVTCVCGVKTTLDCRNTNSNVPRTCAGCNAKYDNALYSWITGYREWHRAVAGSDYKVTFRIPVQSDRD
jgi:hypothetical protein